MKYPGMGYPNYPGTESVTNVPLDMPRIAICPYCGTGLGIEEGELPPRPRLGKQARAMIKAMGEKYVRADFQYIRARGEPYWGYYRERRDGIAEAIRAAVRAALEAKEEE